MKNKALLALCAATIAALPLSAQDPAKPEFPSPPEIVAKAKAEEWVAIAPSDLLVMDLAGVPDGKVLRPRRVVIQLMPAPFSQGWVGNIRKLAAAKFWDGTSINRVQDNYVVQWGDATEKKALPKGLAVVPESGYEHAIDPNGSFDNKLLASVLPSYLAAIDACARENEEQMFDCEENAARLHRRRDPYGAGHGFYRGWPAGFGKKSVWLTHCYAMVGVGRNLSPDTGTGAELYTVIGHAPRHLDRNIALVGRVIEGIDHLSSLPRGTGALGFYENEAERVPIVSVRLGSEMESDKSFPIYEYLSTESASFAAYADARANRRDPFFIKPAGGADICNIPVPIRRKAS
jgi:cyclophilin family peptidyl-prolyl cis-trans isomerase